MTIEFPISTLRHFAEFESAGSKNPGSKSFVVIHPPILGKSSNGRTTRLAVSFMTNSMLDLGLSASRWACHRVRGPSCEDTGNTE